jgi:hypothetical protein
MIPGLVQAFSSPACVLAIVAGLLSFALGRSPAWPLLAAVRPGGAVVITATLAATVYVGVTALTAVFNT